MIADVVVVVHQRILPATAWVCELVLRARQVQAALKSMLLCSFLRGMLLPLTTCPGVGGGVAVACTIAITVGVVAGVGVGTGWFTKPLRPLVIATRVSPRSAVLERSRIGLFIALLPNALLLDLLHNESRQKGQSADSEVPLADDKPYR